MEVRLKKFNTRNSIRNAIGSFPSVTQIVLAAIAGMMIGLLFATLIKAHKLEVAIKAQIAKLQNQKNIEVNTPAPVIQIVPTLERRMNVLVMGVDSNGKNTQRFVGTKSDTMMLVCADPTAKHVGVISIPRDSRVAIEGHGNDKINSAHALGGADSGGEHGIRQFQCANRSIRSCRYARTKGSI